MIIQLDLFNDRAVVQFDMFSGAEIREEQRKKRTSFVGFFVTDKEKEHLQFESETEGVSVSECIRLKLGFDK